MTINLCWRCGGQLRDREWITVGRVYLCAGCAEDQGMTALSHEALRAWVEAERERKGEERTTGTEVLTAPWWTCGSESGPQFSAAN